MKPKQTYFILLVLLIALTGACQYKTDEIAGKLEFTDSISAYGNSWVVENAAKNQQVIQQTGIVNWSEKSVKIRTYFRVEQTGSLNVGINGKTKTGNSLLKVTCGNQSKEVLVENTAAETVDVGVFEIEEPGYHWIEFEGLEKQGDVFADIETVLIGGEAVVGKVYFVKDDFYWGHRGPSVHLNYHVPESAGDVQFFYSEIVVPDGKDAIGSYYMANGFGQGYFGMQVNSSTERRVLFSVWSPFQTDNPNDIPEEDRIVLLKKGDGVHAGEFGNEGSGGQSYLRYNWKAGTNYRFLLKGEPSGNNSTDFTGWFFAPEEGEWKLVASFRRPKTNTRLTRLHSFLENFLTDTGDQTRMAYYSNQWVCNTSGEWTELTKVKFTADATARKDSRLDYAGGAENSKFFLKNCGFFSDRTPFDSFFEREKTETPPQINLEDLP
ncbi:protein of unknown function [Mariniphaga anaerophila]|uniref:DUF5077 domain-containing protein n=1 Tax=Mariniphaga anaerophila TaxID=1484053 RepID=A0A1M5AKS2_9BACT|nr:DUF3472 domain-containing protein [Mariniphaga anaerophila]SHF30878.1 protein of unknown function [Mariniphaga anaerophila]